MADKGWQREFEDPIPLPDGRMLVKLIDAGNYITTLPQAVHTAPEWQAAMEALILVVDLAGPTMFARIGFMQALNRDHVRMFNPDRPGSGGNHQGLGGPGGRPSRTLGAGDGNASGPQRTRSGSV
jgi:hypothetical protein